MSASDDMAAMQREAEAKGMAPQPITPPGVEPGTGEYTGPIPAQVCDPAELANLPALRDSTPAAMLALAVGKGLDVQSLERLMALYERYEENQARKAFFAALAEFQSEVPPLVKDKSVSYGDTHYKHASLGSIAQAIREPLKRHGLSYRFTIENDENGISVACVVTHVQGHSEPTKMGSPSDSSGKKNPIQSLGSSVTYLQRYTLIAALGLTTADEDMDGRSPQREPEGQPAPAKPATVTPRPANGTPNTTRRILAGTKGQPVQGIAVKVGDILRGVDHSIQDYNGKTYWRVEHVNGSCSMFAEEGADPTPVPACVKDGALNDHLVGLVIETKKKTTMFLFADVRPVEGPDAAKGPQAPPAAPTPPPQPEDPKRAEALEQCKAWMAKLGPIGLPIQAHFFKTDSEGKLTPPESASTADLLGYWRAAHAKDEEMKAAPKEEPAAEGDSDNPPF